MSEMTVDHIKIFIYRMFNNDEDKKKFENCISVTRRKQQQNTINQSINQSINYSTEM